MTTVRRPVESVAFMGIADHAAAPGPALTSTCVRTRLRARCTVYCASVRACAYIYFLYISLYICMYAYMYVYMYIYIHTHTYIHRFRIYRGYKVFAWPRLVSFRQSVVPREVHKCIYVHVHIYTRGKKRQREGEKKRKRRTGVKRKELVSSARVIPRSRWVSRMTMLCPKGVREYAARVGASPTTAPPPLSRFPPPSRQAPGTTTTEPVCTTERGGYTPVSESGNSDLTR